MKKCAIKFLEQIDLLKLNDLVPGYLKNGLGHVATFVDTLAQDASNNDFDGLAKKLNKDGRDATGQDIKKTGALLTGLFKQLGQADFNAAKAVQDGANTKHVLCRMFSTKAKTISGFLRQNPNSAE